MWQSFEELQRNDPLRMAAATAFFTTFALPPILIIIVRLFGVFVDRRIFISGLFKNLESILDTSSVIQVREILTHFRSLNLEWYVALCVFVFLLFVATTLFNVIRNSLDQIWKIGMKDHPGIVIVLKLRLRGIIIIILAGVLFVVVLFTEGMRALLGNYLESLIPAGRYLNSAANEIFSVIVVTIWFTVLFRMLTNGRPDWKNALAGGFLTGSLFTLGKYAVRFLLSISNIGIVYGASGSIVLILLFVFYSSFIFYYGACFIKTLSIYRESPIIPLKGAFNYEIQEIIEDDHDISRLKT